ncbi:serine hydrolase [Kribbella steppae]
MVRRTSTTVTCSASSSARWYDGITGLRPGTYLRQAIGDPLGLQAWIGLPESQLGNLARLVEAEGRPAMPGPEHLLTRIVTMNGALVFPGLDVPHGWNDPALLGMELPGAGAVASATGLAGLYSAAVAGDRLLTTETVTDLVRELSAGQGFLGFDAGARWGSGVLLDSSFRPMLGARSFGNDGAGGQFAFGDDEHEVGFAYVANRMLGHGDPRATNLITALRTCLS